MLTEKIQRDEDNEGHTVCGVQVRDGRADENPQALPEDNLPGTIRTRVTGVAHLISLRPIIPFRTTSDRRNTLPVEPPGR